MHRIRWIWAGFDNDYNEHSTGVFWVKHSFLTLTMDDWNNHVPIAWITQVIFEWRAMSPLVSICQFALAPTSLLFVNITIGTIGHNSVFTRYNKAKI